MAPIGAYWPFSSVLVATTGLESHTDRPGLPYRAGESISSVVSVIVAVSFFRREEIHIDIGHVPAVTQYPEVHYLLFSGVCHCGCVVLHVGTLLMILNFRVGFRPIFGQTWPQNLSRSTGLVLQCRLHQKSEGPGGAPEGPSGFRHVEVGFCRF